MHFWIDKRSQCAYTGRHRVSSSLSTGVGRGRGRVCDGARKGMAAPVHRFVVCSPRRRPRSPPRRAPRPHRPYGPPPLPAVHARRAADAPAPYAPVPRERPTIASLAAARSVTPDTLLRTAALGLHAPMMAPHLKFGMLVSFALATVILAGAKYYFDRQVVHDNSSGGEVNVVLAAVSMACVCSVGCALSLCRAPPAPPLTPDRVSSTARRAPPAPPPPAPPAPPAAPPPGAGEAPPPYHIAVLLPPRSPPPPAYSALS